MAHSATRGKRSVHDRDGHQDAIHWRVAEAGAQAVVRSFAPDKVTVTIGGEKLEPAPGLDLVPRGPDRDLSVDEVGGIQLATAGTLPGR